MATKKKTKIKSSKKPKAPAAKRSTFQRGRPFKKGQSGNPKGRARGSKNYKTKFIEEKLAALGCDPIEGMVALAEDKNTETGIRAKLYCELANYLFPKRKAIELDHKGTVDLEKILNEAHSRVKCFRGGEKWLKQFRS